MNNIDIQIKEKEILGIVGESGSGKTTLLNSIISFLDMKKFIVTGDFFLLKYRNCIRYQKKKEKNFAIKISQ